MNALLKKACMIAVVVIIALMFLFGVVGCSKKSGAIWGSPYNVDYKIASADNVNAGIEVIVKGPAARLVVTLTDPEGRLMIKIIEKEEMIANCQTVTVPMRDLRGGTWVLAVKNFDTGQIVWKKNISLSLGSLAVADVKFDLVPQTGLMGNFVGYRLDGIKVVLKKDGNLPVKFTDAFAAIDGKECNIMSSIHPRVMVAQQQTVDMIVYYLPCDPGHRGIIKGTFFYGRDQSLVFEKEFVVPANRVQNITNHKCKIFAPGAPALLPRQK